jgi:hypothetical protein
MRSGTRSSRTVLMPAMTAPVGAGVPAKLISPNQPGGERHVPAPPAAPATGTSRFGVGDPPQRGRGTAGIGCGAALHDYGTGGIQAGDVG